jgi:hypothetical protein
MHIDKARKRKTYFLFPSAIFAPPFDVLRDGLLAIRPFLRDLE